MVRFALQPAVFKIQNFELYSREACWRHLHTAVHYIAATTVQVMKMKVIFAPFGFRYVVLPRGLRAGAGKDDPALRHSRSLLWQGKEAGGAQICCLRLTWYEQGHVA